MSKKEIAKKDFSNEVNEKISTVFQNFAVNPLNKNVDDRIASLEKRIFDTNKKEPSLKDTISRNSNDIQRSIEECWDELKEKLLLLESLEDLPEDLTSAKNAIIRNQTLINENQKALFDDLNNKTSVLSTETSEQFKTIVTTLKATEEALIKKYGEDKAEIFQVIKNSDEALQEAINSSKETMLQTVTPAFEKVCAELTDTKSKSEAHTQKVTDLINSSSEELGEKLDTTTNNIVSFVENAVTPVSNRLNEINEVTTTLYAMVEELDKKNQTLKTMLTALLAINGAVGVLTLVIVLLMIF